MRLTALFVLLLTCLPVQAQDSARARFDAFSRGVQGLSASFEQVVHGSDGVPVEQSAGTVMLRAPRQFRWEYTRPFPQLIVADGVDLWIYDPDLEQVTVRDQGQEEEGSPLAVLIDPAELDRRFVATEDGRDQGLAWLKLVPRKPGEAPFDQARLGFGPAGLAQMELFDGLGQRTVLRFSAWRRNPAFRADAFAFVPPPGVDVVGEPARPPNVVPVTD